MSPTPSQRVDDALERVELAERMNGAGMPRGWFALRDDAVVLAAEVKRLRYQNRDPLPRHDGRGGGI